MSSDFCLYLKFMKELVTEIGDYRYYGKEEAQYALSILNRIVKENKGLFALSPNILVNYKKMVNILSKSTNKEVLRANTYILELENTRLNKEEYINYFSSLHGLNNIDVIKTIIFDSDVLPYVIYHETFYETKYDNPKLLKASLNYFLKKDPQNKEIYDSFRRYYYYFNNKKKYKSNMNIKDMLFVKTKLTTNNIELSYEPNEFLNLVNTYIRKNVGLLCLSDNILNNYQKILNYFEEKRPECRKDFFISYAVIMFIQSLTEEEKQSIGLLYLENERKSHNLDYLDIQTLPRVFNCDFLVYYNYLHNLTYCDEYVNASFRYFINIDKINISSYNKMIQKYKEETIIFDDYEQIIDFPIYESDTKINDTPCEIIKFPKKKSKILNMFFRK